MTVFPATRELEFINHSTQHMYSRIVVALFRHHLINLLIEAITPSLVPLARTFGGTSTSNVLSLFLFNAEGVGEK